MPKYKLTYFNGRARGELARMLFAAADKPFEDTRVEFADWPKLKGGMPQGSLPVLQIDGKTTVCQSLAIARYLAREFGFYGKRKEDDVITDQILDTLLDTFTPYSKLIFNPNADEKKKQMAEFYEKTLPTELGYLVELVKKTGNKGFAVGSALSLSDLAIYVYIENCGADAIGKLKDYPLLATNRKKVEENPRIANYLKKRPVTDF